MSTVAASSTPLFVRLNTTCTTDPATGVEGCYSAVVRDPRGPPRAPRVTEPPPVILDVDTGIDDSLALLYACASPEVELVAATCVAGNVDARQVAVNTRAVLELADRADVEVALGRETPLVRPLTTTPETHGPRGIGYAELPPPSRPLSRRHAVDLLVDEARRRPGELTLVALGPLTNVALAALREPELPVLLRRLVIMGGSYRSPGNTAPTTEWNISVDPDAAAVVFTHFGAPEVHAAPTPPRPPRPSSAILPMPCASTWSSTAVTTASTAPSSTIHWRWPRPSTPASCAARRWPSTWSWAASSPRARRSPTGAASGASRPTSTSPWSRTPRRSWHGSSNASATSPRGWPARSPCSDGIVATEPRNV